jgi:hypothetical protein
MTAISSLGTVGGRDQPRDAADGKAGTRHRPRHITAMRPSIAALLALPLAACTPSADQQLGQPGIGAAIKSYYEAHAWERNAVCTRPGMVSLNTVTPVRETADELVVEVRYRYTPLYGDSVENNSGRNYCADWGTRRFTLARQGGGLTVTSMTGEQRPPGR